MADVLTPAQRHLAMSRARGKNTKPELIIRRALFGLGLRYRLHNKKLPGTPDIVFPRYRVCIFINGCFWHYHGCKTHNIPSTDEAFWLNKFQKNVARDHRVVNELLVNGWRVLTIWECAIRGKSKIPFCLLIDDILRFILSGLPERVEIGGRQIR